VVGVPSCQQVIEGTAGDPTEGGELLFTLNRLFCVASAEDGQATQGGGGSANLLQRWASLYSLRAVLGSLLRRGLLGGNNSVTAKDVDATLRTYGQDTLEEPTAAAPRTVSDSGAARSASVSSDPQVSMVRPATAVPLTSPPPG